MDKTKLTEIGLGKNEVEIYLALLTLGKSTATKLAQKTGIHRTYIYDVLEKLKERGLVSQIKEENKQYSQAADPERIKEYLLEKLNTIENLLPELKKIRKSEEETTVEVYKGKEGIKTILNDFIKTGEDYCAIGAMKQFEENLPIYSKQVLIRQEKKGMKGKVILEEGEKILEYKGEEYRYLPKEYISLSSFVTYADKVALFIWKEPYIQILIKNKDVAKSYLTQFNILWKMASKHS